jgi:hypothetical protein
MTKFASRSDLQYLAAFCASFMALVVAGSAASLATVLIRPPFPADVATIDHYNLLVLTVGTAATALLFGGGFAPLTWALHRAGAKPRPGAARRGAVVATLLSLAFLLVAANSVLFAWSSSAPTVAEELLSMVLVGLFYPAAWFLANRV